jgi:hypothetical protein
MRSIAGVLLAAVVVLPGRALAQLDIRVPAPVGFRHGGRQAAVAIAPQETKVPAGTQELKITLVPAEPAASPVSISLGPRNGRVLPFIKGCAHTGGGNIDVAQPTPDTLVVTMTGAAVTCCDPLCPSEAALDFTLDQWFKIHFDDKDLKRAKLTIESRAIGLLRSDCAGAGVAEVGNAFATVTAGGAELLSLAGTDHAISGQSLSVNDRTGPLTAWVFPGTYGLHQTFRVAAHSPQSIVPSKSVSAEFADGAVDRLWLSVKEPFYGAVKKEFGFQMTIKVVADPEPAAKP